MRRLSNPDPAAQHICHFARPRACVHALGELKFKSVQMQNEVHRVDLCIKTETRYTKEQRTRAREDDHMTGYTTDQK